MNFDKKEIQILIDIELSQAEKRFGKEFKAALIKIISLEKLLTPQPVIQEKQSRIIPLSEWNKYHPYPTKGTLYQWNFNKEKNGFDYCTEKGGEKGHRVLINEDKFWEWHSKRFSTD